MSASLEAQIRDYGKNLVDGMHLLGAGYEATVELLIAKGLFTREEHGAAMALSNQRIVERTAEIALGMHHPAPDRDAKRGN